MVLKISQKIDFFKSIKELKRELENTNKPNLFTILHDEDIRDRWILTEKKKQTSRKNQAPKVRNQAPKVYCSEYAQNI